MVLFLPTWHFGVRTASDSMFFSGGSWPPITLGAACALPTHHLELFFRVDHGRLYGVHHRGAGPDKVTVKAASSLDGATGG